ncbi:MAG: hypothetical protein WBD20_09470 [Pirellulaceae bacterium]
MIEEPTQDAVADETVASQFTGISLRYAGQSRYVADGDQSQLALFGNLQRDPVHLDGVLKNPIQIREALSALYAVVGSDYRYVPKDRTAYHAFQRMRRESANQGSWRAQHAYFDWLSRNDPLAFLILDPVISVHPDKVFFEVFSKDEGTYANLSISMDAFNLTSDPVCGTTNIDFSEPLFQSISRFRSYRETRLTIGQQGVAIDTDGSDQVLEKKIKIPDSWLRGFLQVQSSALLPTDSFSIAPIDLYNALRHLRMNGDRKGKRRGIRIELVPNEKPRLVLEPWETVIQTSQSAYAGREAKVIRVWGRRRLSLLRRMLPFVETVDVHLTGSGLPSFWVLKSPQMTFTMAITGFTASNWSKALDFDLLLPRNVSSEKSAQKPLEKIVKHLSKTWRDDKAGLTKATKLSGEDLVQNVQLGCQHGQLMFDVPDQVYRLRPLTEVPLDMERLEFRSPFERSAFDLVHRKNAVAIVNENRIYGSGLELTGKAEVKEDRREYRPQLLVSDDGFVGRAECTCNQFRTQGLKAGPCTHLIALRLAHAVRQQKRRDGKGTAITVETRTYSKRTDGNEHVYQVSLDRKRVKVRWGTVGQKMRIQQLQYPTIDDARDDYLARVKDLSGRGYLDASAE